MSPAPIAEQPAPHRETTHLKRGASPAAEEHADDQPPLKRRTLRHAPAAQPVEEEKTEEPAPESHASLPEKEKSAAGLASSGEDSGRTSREESQPAPAPAPNERNASPAESTGGLGSPRTDAPSDASDSGAASPGAHTPAPQAIQPHGLRRAPPASMHACGECGKVYKHRNCLVKHHWEHHALWPLTKRFCQTKHQQVQLMEAAHVLSEMVVPPAHRKRIELTTLPTAPAVHVLRPHAVAAGAHPVLLPAVLMARPADVPRP